MFEVIGKEVSFNVMTLDEAMKTAKVMNEFVTIKSKDYEIVGMFGTDTIKNGKCPDGVEYSWMKRRNQ